jgi:hypothetical protein
MRLGCVALSAVIGLAGAAFGERSQRFATSAPADAPVTAPTAADDRVRIEHQIVQIPVIPASDAPALRLKKAAGRPGTSAPAVTTRQARSNSTRRDPLLSRAVQRILGDGRHTPQPFPRPGR